ncbi:hypothetical protein EDD86DRAFT_243818 [Gorgonomyces haynaldii]|nr:hypothetical protein EDD86DRAFT_243818 [Gorgonomyces haynaldii]
MTQLREDIISKLPDELSLKILSYLTRNDILTCSLVNKRWNLLSNDDAIWKAFCMQDWQHKQFTTMNLAHRLDLRHVVRLLNIREMKQLLELRKVKTVGLLEKSEWIEALANSTPKYSPAGPWLPKWKASYVAKHLDSKRTQLIKDELCSIKWKFRFLNGWPEQQPDLSCKFHEDYNNILL